MDDIKQVAGHTGYLITKDGFVFSIPRRVKKSNNRLTTVGGKWLTAKPKPVYLAVRIGGKDKYIHRLVAETFIPNTDKLPAVNHKDGNKLNNHVSNLEWTSYSQNNIHAYSNGLMASGEKHSQAKLSADTVEKIRAMYKTGLHKQRDLAEMFGCVQSYISAIVSGEKRKHG